MNQTTLELKGGIKFYVSGREITRALSDINVSFRTGEFVAITGESGSGKSTLAHILAGVFQADKGALYVNGESTIPYGEAEWETYRRDTVSFVAQNYGILPGVTVLDNVVMALLLSGMTGEQALERAEKLLRQVELWKYKNRRAAKLSSGQKQRLSVARAVAKPAPVLIADEPTSNLDAGNTEQLIALFREEAKNRLVIMVTHDFEAVKEHVTRHVEIRDGLLVGDKVLEPEQQEKIQKECEGSPAGEKKRNRESKTGSYVAFRMLKARPVWSFLTVFLFALTSFATFAFLGTFFSVLDDADTRYYTPDAFYNGNSRRLAVVRQDGQPMEAADYEKISEFSYVESIEPYGLLSDVNYYYRKNEDYVIKVTAGDGTGGGGYTEIIRMEDNTQFLQTIPELEPGKVFLSAGRLPENDKEVVAAAGEEWLGKSFSMYICDRKQWNSRTYLSREVTVVGLTNYGEGLYCFGTDELVQSIHPELTAEETRCQASVFLEDYAYTNRAKKQLSKMGYEALSPYQMGTIVQDSELAGQRMTTLVLCLVALLIVFVLQCIVMVVMFGTQMSDYRQLRTLGLSYRTGRMSIGRQIRLLTVAGWLLCSLLVFIGAWRKLSLLQNILKYLEPWQVVCFAVIHGLASGLVAMAVKKSLRNSVFRLMPKVSEPELGELEAENREDKHDSDR